MSLKIRQLSRESHVAPSVNSNPVPSCSSSSPLPTTSRNRSFRTSTLTCWPPSDAESYPRQPADSVRQQLLYRGVLQNVLRVTVGQVGHAAAAVLMAET